MISDGSVKMEPFPSDGDMLDFLLQTGKIREKDGLYATWYHSANNKSEMIKALNSKSDKNIYHSFKERSVLS